MSANFTPTMGEFRDLKPFRFWCQKILPVVYDDSLSYYELLCKVVDFLNKTMEDVDTLQGDVTNLHTAYVALQGYVNNYFDNLDVQEEINTKLDQMAESGALTALLKPFIPDLVETWLDLHITPTTPLIDSSLSISGAGADAKVTGDEINALKALKSDLNNILYRNITEITEGLFEKGSLANGLPDTYKENQRARTTMYLFAQNDLQISVKKEQYNDAGVNVTFFDESGTVTTSTGWQLDVTIKKGQIFKVVLDINLIDTATNYTLSEIYNAFIFNYIKSPFKQYTHDDNKYLLFEHGGLSYGENDSYRAHARVRMCDKMICENDILIKYKAGSYVLVNYDSTGTYYDGWGWLQNDRIIPANTPFRIGVTLDPNSSSFSPLQTICDCIDLQIVDKNRYGINPNIIYQCRNVDDTAYPPYSKYYIKAAAENQYDRIRVNVRKTTDGIYVLIHDNIINNVAVMPDGSAIAETVQSDGHTLAQLNAYDWGLKYGKRYAGLTVPTLETACEYVAMYNLGLTIEISFADDDSDIENICNILNEYGVSEKCIVIDGSLFNTGYYNKLLKWVETCPFISPCIGGNKARLEQYITEINNLNTTKNNIYCGGIETWGTEEVTEETREFIINNGWLLYSSNAMNKNILFIQVGFNHGYTLIETNNIYMVKDTIREYANSLVDN